MSSHFGHGMATGVVSPGLTGVPDLPPPVLMSNFAFPGKHLVFLFPFGRIVSPLQSCPRANPLPLSSPSGEESALASPTVPLWRNLRMGDPRVRY